MAKRRVRHYVNNPEFYEALVEYKKECNVVEKQWLKVYRKEKEKLLKTGLSEKKAMKELPPIDYPQIPKYIGECIYHIATNLAKRPNFFGYSYKEEMIADGYEDCVKHIRSFDPEKSKNPFAYFTQTCWFAAIRRIKKEQKQTEIKALIVRNSNIIPSMEANVQDMDDGEYINSYIQFLQENLDDKETEADEERQARPLVKKTTLKYQKELKEKEAAAIVEEDVRLNSTKEYMAEIEEEQYDE